MTAVRARRITQELLGGTSGRFTARVVATEPGVVAGVSLLEQPVDDPSGSWQITCADGDALEPGDVLMLLTGTAWELAVAEDHAMGVLGLAGGLARQAVAVRSAAPVGLRLVCGPWKKWPATLKPLLRAALSVADVGHRLLENEFVYVPKNHVRMLGGIGLAIERARTLDHGPVAIQVMNSDEALAAASAEAQVIMLDDGGIDELSRTHHRLLQSGLRERVQLAFGGRARAVDLADLQSAGAEIVDLGREILNAPLWDLRMTVAP